MKITLIGSTRFLDSFHYWNVLLSNQGHIVYSVAQMTSQSGALIPPEQKLDLPHVDRVQHELLIPPEQKLVLDAVHMGKIVNSDAVFVITTNYENAITKGKKADTYIGESTAREVYFAQIMQKRIFADRNCGQISEGCLSQSTKNARDWFKRGE